MHFKSINLCILLVSFIVVATGVAGSFSPQLTINNKNILESYGDNVYVIDFSKNDNANKQFVLTCSSGPNALDLNLTFTGLRSRIEKVNNFFKLSN